MLKQTIVFKFKKKFFIRFFFYLYLQIEFKASTYNTTKRTLFQNYL